MQQSEKKLQTFQKQQLRRVHPQMQENPEHRQWNHKKLVKPRKVNSTCAGHQRWRASRNNKQQTQMQPRYETPASELESESANHLPRRQGYLKTHSHKNKTWRQPSGAEYTIPTWTPWHLVPYTHIIQTIINKKFLSH